MKKSSKKFGGFKNLPYLCIRFRQRNGDEGFKNGSLNYWLYLREKM